MIKGQAGVFILAKTDATSRPLVMKVVTN